MKLCEASALSVILITPSLSRIQRNLQLCISIAKHVAWDGAREYGVFVIGCAPHWT